MLEKVIEDLIASFPDQFFDEKLKLVHRQKRIKGRILDLLFEDESGRLFLLEIKAFALKRQDVGQAGEYFGLMRTEFPERQIRMGVFATSVAPELKIYLEAFGVEVYIVSIPALEQIALRNNVDPVRGIEAVKAPRPAATTEPRDPDRIDVTNEQEYFKLIEILDVSVQERLAAIYGVVKKNPNTVIRFNERGRVVVSVHVENGKTVDVMYVGVDFKGPKQFPARGTLTLLWKTMLPHSRRAVLEPLALRLDEMLSRTRADIFLDPAENPADTTR